jgi:hypothetical protein
MDVAMGGIGNILESAKNENSEVGKIKEENHENSIHSLPFLACGTFATVTHAISWSCAAN